jgi:hypothetical protein
MRWCSIKPSNLRRLSQSGHVSRNVSITKAGNRWANGSTAAHAHTKIVNNQTQNGRWRVSGTTRQHNIAERH